MIRRTTRILLELLLGALLLVAVPMAVLFWRLTSGPVEIGFLTPYVKTALQGSFATSEVEIGATQLNWLGWSQTVDLQAKDVRFLDREGGLAITLPEISLKLSLQALLRGRVAPTQVAVRNASIFLVREKGGELKLEYSSGGDSVAEQRGDVSFGLDEFLEKMVPAAEAGGQTSQLNEVVILQSNILVVDKSLNRVWSLPLERLSVSRSLDGIEGALTFGIGSGAKGAAVDAAFVYDKNSGALDLAGEFSGITSDILVDALAAPSELLLYDGVFSGKLSAGLNSEEELKFLRVALDAGAGTLDLDDFGYGRVPLRGVSVLAILDNIENKLVLEGLQAHLGSEAVPGPEFRLNGTIEGAGDLLESDLKGAIELSSDAISVDDLPAYWPADLAPDSRDWITGNLKKGRVHDLTADLELSLARGEIDEDPDVTIDSFGGGFVVEDLEVHFLRPLPPITGAHGRAIFDLENFAVTVEKGDLGDLRISAGNVIIAGLLEAQTTPGVIEDMSIDLKVAGPLRNAFELLDHERLDLLSGLGLDPAKSQGNAEVDLAFAFPLKKDLEFDEMQVSAKGPLRDVAIESFFRGLDATGGQLSLDLLRSGMRVAGDVTLGGIGLEIDWSEAFEGDPGYRSYIRARTSRLDAAGRRNLGLEVEDLVQGAVAANVFLTLQDDGSGEGKTAVAFDEASLSLDALSWRKAIGLPAQGRFNFRLVEDRITELDLIEVRTEDLDVVGRGVISPEGGLSHLTLDRFAFPAGAFEDVTVIFTEAGEEVSIGAGWVDAGYFQAVEEEMSEEERGQQERAPFTLTAGNLERLIFGPGRELLSADLRLEQVSSGWRRVFLEGVMPETLKSPPLPDEPRTKDDLGPKEPGDPGSANGPTEDQEAKLEAPLEDSWLTVDFAPDPEGTGQVLAVKANDFGSVLRLFDLTNAVIGGTLDITGTGEGPYPGYTQAFTIEAEDFVVTGAPTTVRLMTLGSFSGLTALLDGTGLPMKKLVGRLTLEDGVLATDLLRVYGGALGLTVEGQVDMRADMIDVGGTVVPSYSINSILGEIPILGQIFVGGEGEGVFAATYEIVGSVEDPSVEVDALAALAPGFLRGLVTGERGEDEGAMTARPAEKEFTRPKSD